jgi:hypothetical protein
MTIAHMSSSSTLLQIVPLNGATLAPQRRQGIHQHAETTLPTRDRFAPEDREDDIEIYDVAPADMPPAPAGAGAEIGGEAAASRRLAGLPPDLAREPEHQPGIVSSQPEPFLGYEGLNVDDLLDWIDQEDPGPDLLQRIIEYEADHRERDLILDECRERIQRWEESD